MTDNISDKTILIVTQDDRDAARYATYLEDGGSDYGFLAVGTVGEAVEFCDQLTPDCLIVDDSVSIPQLLTELAGKSELLPCAVITISKNTPEHYRPGSRGIVTINMKGSRTVR
jgi:CheY-like chemotaxis protein